MNHATRLPKIQLGIFSLAIAVAIGCCVLTALFNEKYFLAIPVGLAFAYWCLVDYKSIFFFFFLLLPFSIEVELPGGLGTDLPSEPLMWFFMVSAFFLLLWKARKLPPEMFTNRLSVVIFLHVLWIGITSLLSSYPMISLKFFLAKLWYVIPFFFLPLMLLKVDDLKVVQAFTHRDNGCSQLCDGQTCWDGLCI